MKKVTTVLLTTFLLVPLLANAEESLMIVLKEKPPREVPLPEHSTTPAEVAAWKQERISKFAKYHAKLLRELRTNGFIEMENAFFDHGILTYTVDQTRWVTPDVAFQRLTFSPHPLPSFAEATLQGVIADPDEDGKTNECTRIYKFRDLGMIIVTEFDYTVANGLTVSRPNGEISINGKPAGYAVYRNKERTRGLTRIRYINDNRLFRITVAKAIEKSDPQFDKLMWLVSDLY